MKEILEISNKRLIGRCPLKEWDVYIKDNFWIGIPTEKINFLQSCFICEKKMNYTKDVLYISNQRLNSRYYHLKCVPKKLLEKYYKIKILYFLEK